MSTEAMTLFFAMLAVAADAMVAVAVVGSLAARVSPVARRLWRGVVDVIGPHGFGLALAVAAAATAASLYLSEVAHFPPCRLCWYQRAAMYPLVPLLALAAWRRWSRVRPWAAALAGAGACVSIYHVALQQFPSLGSTTCDPTNPCTLLWVEHFGYLTIPAMALSGFALIISLLLVSASHERADPADRSPIRDRVHAGTTESVH